MSKRWDKSYTLKSFRAAVHTGAVNRNMDTWLVVRGDRVIEGARTLQEADHAMNILNDNEIANRRPGNYTILLMGRDLVGEVTRGEWYEAKPMSDTELAT